MRPPRYSSQLQNVLLFAIGLGSFGRAVHLAPAIKVSRTDLNADLKSEGRAASSGRSQGRLRAVLVTVRSRWRFSF